MIAPGAWLGLLGGGQLGRMFAMAAQSLGYRVLVLDPDASGPAASVADAHLQAGYEDEDALAELARRCAAATTEFENVPAGSLRLLARHHPVSPAAESVAIAQDRIEEKAFFARMGLRTAPHRVVRGPADLDGDLSAVLPGILKRSRLGYDGKGQVGVATAAEAQAAFAALGGVPCVLERHLSLDCELSVVVARDATGQVSSWPVAENRHAGGILDVSIVPARVDPALAAEAREAAVDLARQLDYRGILCLEFFVCGGRLHANEMAPRPHNSGHYTIDACVTSQFEQQARVLCGLPLGATEAHCPAVMVNLLGDLWTGGEPRWEHVLRHPRAKLHLYGKHQARPGRKMGHFTVLDQSAARALATAEQIRALLLSDAQARPPAAQLQARG